MGRLVLRRLLGAAVTFVLATVVVFLVTFALPGDPARTIAGRRQPTEATLRAIRLRYHLDEPLINQYLRWMGGLLRGDLGESYASRRQVTTILLEALPVSMTLLAVTLAIELVIGIAVGTAVGSQRGGRLDVTTLVACIGALAVPAFVAGVVLQDLVGVRWRLLPVAGIQDGLVSYLLPGFVLSLTGMAVATRLIRAETLESQHAQHVRTAVSKGLRQGAVTRRHVLYNSLVPFLSFVGLEIGALAAGSIVVERVFNLPGVGRAVARAISQRDNTLIIGFSIATIAVYLVVDLVVDVAALLIDPRLRQADT